MASTTTPELQPVEEYKDKGLKGGALGLISSIVIGVASTAPAYSLAATLVFVVAAVGLKSPSASPSWPSSRCCSARSATAR